MTTIQWDDVPIDYVRIIDDFPQGAPKARDFKDPFIRSEHIIASSNGIEIHMLVIEASDAEEFQARVIEPSKTQEQLPSAIVADSIVRIHKRHIRVRSQW